MSDYIKSLMVRTPLEGVLKRARQFVRFTALLNHPELLEIHLEESRIERAIRKALRPTSNCIDVGCHLGVILSLFMKFAPRGRHMAFEPIPHQARWIGRKFPEVDVRQLALSDAAGELTFYVNADRSGYSGLHRLANPEDRVQEIRVRTDRLDDVIDPGHRVDFLKVVVEGAELSVLRGAEGIIHRDRPILLFECVPMALEKFGSSIREVSDFLTERHAYSIFLLKDYLLDAGEALEIERFENATLYPFNAFKFIALRKS